MRIWITGCAGFLGTRLARAFIAAGHQVVGLSRRASPIPCKYISIDLASDVSRSQLQELGKNIGYPDVVIHTAARQPGQYGFSEFVKSNVLTTANLLDVLRGFPARLVVYTSTLSVYGRPDLNPVKETSLIKGNSLYALTKRWSEQLLEAFQERSQVIVLRLPSLYGVGQADSFIDGLARLAMKNEVIELYGRGETVRDALHVDEVVTAALSCVTSPPQTRFCFMNLGCGQRITTHEYAQALLKALGSRSQIVPIDRASPQQFDLYADIEKARRLIGFSPFPLQNSIRRYADELHS